MRDLRAVVAALGAERVVVAGHSTAGSTALAFAAGEPGRVAGLALLDVDPFRFKDGLERLLRFRGPESAASVEELVDALVAAGDSRSHAAIERSLADQLRRTSDGRWTWKQDPRLRPAADVAPARPRPDAEVVDTIRRLEAPTLLLRGARSAACTEAGGRHFLDLVGAKLGRLEEIASAGHDLLGDAPAAVAAAIDRFLARSAR